MENFNISGVGNEQSVAQSVAQSAVQVKLIDKKNVTEINGDFSLPDYQPEIKRLLRIKPCALPAAHYIGSGNLELDGNVDYYVIYTGSDGGVYCAPLTAEYSVSTQLDYDSADLGSNFVCDAHISADEVNGRVTAPRKLNIRCKMTADVKLYGDRMIGSNQFGEDCEVLTGSAECGRILRGRGETLRLADDMIPDQRLGNIRIICAEGNVMVNRAEAGNGGVNCMGEVLLKLMLAREESDDNMPVTVIRKIPFSQVINIDTLTSDSYCCAEGFCTEMSVEVGDGSIHSDIGIILDVTAQKNQRVGYVKDTYSVKRKTQCENQTVKSGRALGCMNGNFTFGDSLPLSQAGIPADAKIMDITGRAKINEVICENGKCMMNGDAEFSVLIASGDGEMSGTNVNMPFRYQTEGSDVAPEDWFADAEVVNCRGRIDGERIGIDAEMAVTAHLDGETSIGYVRSVDFGEEFQSGGAEMVICYPAPDDTLWSVAKRYHVPVSDAAEANGIKTDSPESNIKGKKCLFV